ncbi:LuxR C-terminal-related transcriptional regulator [Phenylobacterium sp.]|uniref:response regulator transcription factor n=1 Tax=Phenylobacterium sp. TaxID=1871053 RepID=UPI00286A3FE8|nr:LuxR C-terminal-related transcriptional regulator [Phenylobacterium sp.]
MTHIGVLFGGGDDSSAVVSTVRAARGEGPEILVHIVEPEETARRGLADLLVGAGIESRAYADVGEFLSARHGDAPGCLVVDARLSLAADGELRRRMQPLGLDYPMVVTACGADVALAVRAMKAGAVDVLARPLREAETLAAVRAGIQLDRDQRLDAARKSVLGARFSALTPRERQVMSLVTRGRMNKQVAGDLGISEITVKAHRGSVMRKMAARTLADLVRMADALGDRLSV